MVGNLLGSANRVNLDRVSKLKSSQGKDDEDEVTMKQNSE